MLLFYSSSPLRIVSVSQARLLQKCLTHAIPNLSQHGLLSIKTPHSARIHITTAWIDHVSLISTPENLHIAKNPIDNTATLSAPDHERFISLDVVVPEYFNLDVSAGNLELTLSKKLMGNLIVRCDSGSINLDKVKGENISLECLAGMDESSVASEIC